MSVTTGIYLRGFDNGIEGKGKVEFKDNEEQAVYDRGYKIGSNERQAIMEAEAAEANRTAGAH